MNIIQELTEKYNGKYSEDLKKNVNSPIGKFIYQPKSGILEINGTKISINLNDVGGAMPVTEPFRIILHLTENQKTELKIFPKNLWYHFIDILQKNKRKYIPKEIRKQFWFRGNKKIITELVSNLEFIKNIKNERIYITTRNEPINQVMLTPEYGIENIEQFEKYVSILKFIEIEYKLHTTTAIHNT